jgi:hypothetical protein
VNPLLDDFLIAVPSGKNFSVLKDLPYNKPAHLKVETKRCLIWSYDTGDESWGYSDE